VRSAWAVAALCLLLAGCGTPAPGSDEPTTSGGGTSHESESSLPTSDAGSTSETTPAPPPAPDSAVLVRLHRWIWVNRTSGDQMPYGDFGHHCGGGKWTEDPPAVLVYDWSYRSSGTTSSGPEPEAWPASGILVSTYEPQETQTFFRTGSSPSVQPFEAEDGVTPVAAVFYQHGPVANVTAAAGVLAVDGEPLARSPSGTLVDREYSFTSGESSYEVHERLRFTSFGDADVTVQHQGHPCI
jgi:hypothetical protein